MLQKNATKRNILIILSVYLIFSCTEVKQYIFSFEENENSSFGVKIEAEITPPAFDGDFTGVNLFISNISEIDSVRVLVPTSNTYLKFEQILEGSYIFRYSNFNSLIMNNNIVVSIYFNNIKTDYKLLKKEKILISKIRGH